MVNQGGRGQGGVGGLLCIAMALTFWLAWRVFGWKDAATCGVRGARHSLQMGTALAMINTPSREYGPERLVCSQVALKM